MTGSDMLYSKLRMRCWAFREGDDEHRV